MDRSIRPRVPSYRFHKATGQARVTIDGRDHYLGTFGTPESKAKYNRLIASHLSATPVAPELPPRNGAPSGYPILMLCDEFFAWVTREYRTPEGEPTGSIENIRLALRKLFELFADVEASEFGPLSLKLYRDELVKSGLARSTVNARVGIVKRAFKWATENERVHASVFHGLGAVSGLRRGRGGARETEPVRPAPEADIEAAKRFMSDPVRTMVELQLLTGARPTEILLMKQGSIDLLDGVWVYRPSAHKSAWRGHEREILLGPRAQALLQPYLCPGAPDEFLFSPGSAELRRRERLRAARRTPLYPSHVRALERKRRQSPKQKPRDHYDVGTYRQAIRRACKKAGVPAWKPNQLRHNAATRLRADFDLQVAKAVLGHRRVETTQIYAEVDREAARRAVKSAG